MDRLVSNFCKSVLGGISISLGCLVYLSCDNRYLGSFLFTIGLTVIFTFNLNLFTGKIGHVTDNKNYLSLVNIWLGNLIGCLVILFFTKFSNLELMSKLFEVRDYKLSIPYLGLIFRSILCGILMYIAVDGYNKLKSNLGILCYILSVMTFILIGAEHCVANMFYILSTINTDSLIFIFINTIGNSIGAILMNYLVKLCEMPK